MTLPMIPTYDLVAAEHQLRMRDAQRRRLGTLGARSTRRWRARPAA